MTNTRQDVSFLLLGLWLLTNRHTKSEGPLGKHLTQPFFLVLKESSLGAPSLSLSKAERYWEGGKQKKALLAHGPHFGLLVIRGLATGSCWVRMSPASPVQGTWPFSEIPSQCSMEPFLSSACSFLQSFEPSSASSSLTYLLSFKLK